MTMNMNLYMNDHVVREYSIQVHNTKWVDEAEANVSLFSVTVCSNGTDEHTETTSTREGIWNKRKGLFRNKLTVCRARLSISQRRQRKPRLSRFTDVNLKGYPYIVQTVSTNEAFDNDGHGDSNVWIETRGINALLDLVRTMPCFNGALSFFHTFSLTPTRTRKYTEPFLSPFYMLLQ